jgi:hypothetical protein
MSTEIDHAEQNARAWMQSIREMVAKLSAEKDDHEDDLDIQEAARDEIQQSVLSVQVRCTEWYSPGKFDPQRPDEFEILLSTGGPALRIFGDLDQHGEPENIKLQKQDWFTPWTDVFLEDDEDTKALDTFTQEFYFGE